jgi:hypothetical protein
MKIINLITVAGVLAVAPVIYAQDQDTVSVPVRANEVRIELPDNYKKMWPADYDAYKGGYTLSNGKTLSVISRGTNMYAYVDNDKWHKIAAVAPNIFVALDRQLKMEINLLEGGEANGWVAMVVPAQQLSSGEIIPEKIVYFAMH